jgi:hypothetical protein
MMNTAMVIAVGEERKNVHSAVSDRGGADGMTFEQTFGESTGLLAGSQAKGGAVDIGMQAQDRKSEVSLKNSEELSAASNTIRGKTLVNKEANESDNAVVVPQNTIATKKSIPVPFNNSNKLSKTTDEPIQIKSEKVQTAITNSAKVSIPQWKTMVSDPKTAGSGPSTGKVREDANVSDDGEKGLKTDESKDKEAMPLGSAATVDQSFELKSNGKLPVNQKKMLGKSMDVVSAKKNEKTKSVSGSETHGGIESPKVADAQLATEPNMRSELFGQAQRSTDVQGNEVGKLVDVGSGKTSSATGKTTVGGTTEATGRRSMDITQAGKFEPEGAEERTDSTVSSPDPSKLGEDLAKSDDVSGPAGRDSNERTNAAAAAMILHPEAANNAGALSAVPGTTFGHVLTDVSGMKVQTGEASVHTASPLAGSAEQDGSGMVDVGATHRMLGATPTTLEVGVINGTQGWLKIRAEMTGNGLVNASLSSPTPGGQEMLHRELPALTAYLHEERVAVNTVVVHAAAATGTVFQPSGRMDAEQNGQMQQHDPQKRSGEERQGLANVASNRTAMTDDGINGHSEDGLLPSGIFIGGSYLNVRA